jgi:hypothetical protein
MLVRAILVSFLMSIVTACGMQVHHQLRLHGWIEGKLSAGERQSSAEKERESKPRNNSAPREDTTVQMVEVSNQSSQWDLN